MLEPAHSSALACMAAGGARAAAEETANHRLPRRRYGLGRKPMGRRLCAAAARTQLYRRPNRCD